MFHTDCFSWTTNLDYALDRWSGFTEIKLQRTGISASASIRLARVIYTIHRIILLLITSIITHSQHQYITDTQ
jgi:hypothetical protein